MRITILVPSGEAYTSFEKLFLPFDDDVWIWIGITIAAAFATIFIVNFLPRFVRDFVFGRDITTPSLNVWVVFCGLSFVKLPTSNFARFILMNFIIFSLIFRTAYQAKNFEFLQQDMHKKGVQTLNEMKEKNLSLYCGTNYFNHFNKFSFLG